MTECVCTAFNCLGVQLEVGSIRRCLEHVGRFDLEGRANILGDLGRGRGGEADDALRPDLLDEAGDLEVVWPERMAPLNVDDQACCLDGKSEECEMGERTSDTQWASSTATNRMPPGMSRIVATNPSLFRRSGAQ